MVHWLWIPAALMAGTFIGAVIAAMRAVSSQP